MTVTRFDRTTANNTLTQAKQSLTEFAQKLGLRVNFTSAKFTDTSLTFKVTMEPLTVDSSVEREKKEAAEAFKRVANSFHLKPEDLNRNFIHKGSEWRVVGYSSSRPKYPFFVERVKDGKQFAFPPSSVQLALGVPANVVFSGGVRGNNEDVWMEEAGE